LKQVFSLSSFKHNQHNSSSTASITLFKKSNQKINIKIYDTLQIIKFLTKKGQALREPLITRLKSSSIGQLFNQITPTVNNNLLLVV